jgi:hypothetical protein
MLTNKILNQWFLVVTLKTLQSSCSHWWLITGILNQWFLVVTLKTLQSSHSHWWLITGILNQWFLVVTLKILQSSHYHWWLITGLHVAQSIVFYAEDITIIPFSLMTYHWASCCSIYSFLCWRHYNHPIIIDDLSLGFMLLNL